MSTTTASVELVIGDCLEVLGARPAGTADVAYLDPPFNTGRRQQADEGAYHDVWGDLETYLDFIRPRVRAIHRMLHDDGVILLHCDWRTCHHLRLVLDDVFGPGGFVNHLVWSYGLGGSSPRRFARKHDDILFYAKSPEYFFEAPRVPARSQRMKGQSKKATDVLDIPSINNMSRERVGYPTQKPLALLELLVQATCPPGGCVVDPFCGSGTSLVAAARTGRRGLGIDCNPDAVRVAIERLASLPQELRVPQSKF